MKDVPKTRAAREKARLARVARTAAAREVVMRRADEKRAAILRNRGWTCVPPEVILKVHGHRVYTDSDGNVHVEPEHNDSCH